MVHVWLLFQPAIAIPIVQLTLSKPSSCLPTLQQTFKDDGSYSFMGLSIVACQVLLGATWPTTGRWASKASFAHCICDYDVVQAGIRRANRMVFAVFHIEIGVVKFASFATQI